MKNKILDRLQNFSGEVGFYYKNLQTNEIIEYNEEKSMLAASLIKLTVLVEVFNQIDKGILKKDDEFITNDNDKVPSCGALNYMHSGLKITIKDLYTLMIILSDNYATNILIDILGIENINKTIKDINLKKTILNRKMFDEEKSSKGIENYTSAKDMGILLEKMYSGELVNKNYSKEMMDVLKNQRLNGKIPFFLHSEKEKIEIAHKTGEDNNITHDVGIVFAKEPFIICFTGNKVDVPLYERLIQDISYELYLNQKNK